MVKVEKSDKFEIAALELIGLNLAFESARSGSFSKELLRLCEEIGDKTAVRSEPGS
jgi:hypothetical protein